MNDPNKQFTNFDEYWTEIVASKIHRTFPAFGPLTSFLFYKTLIGTSPRYCEDKQSENFCVYCTKDTIYFLSNDLLYDPR